MQEINILEIIHIIKNFNNEKMYNHGNNLDILKLFDINLQDSRETILKCQRVRELFRIDFIDSIPLKYRFEYQYIIKEIIHKIPYNEDEILRKMDIIFKNNKKYNELINNMNSQEYEKMINNTRNTYRDKYMSYMKYNKSNIKPKALKRSLKIMHLLINRLKKSSGKNDNIYRLLYISKSKNIESIRSSFWFKTLTDIPNNLIFSYYKEEFQAPSTDAVYFNKIVDLIISADEIYLRDDKSKKAYDLYLNSVKIKNNNKLVALLELEKRYYELSRYNIIDLFYLFGLNKSLSSEDILASEHYKDIKYLLNNKVDYENPLHKRLISTFKELNELLNRKELRDSYEKLINSSKYIVEGKINIVKQKYNSYSIIIDIIIEKYKKIVEKNIFINYYELFNLNKEDSIATIKKDLALINSAIRPEFAMFVSNKEDYNNLINILNIFKNNVLISDKAKKLYDSKLEACKKDINNIDTKYNKKKYQIKYRQHQVILPYIKTIESSLIRNGFAKTVQLLTNYFKYGTGVEEIMFSKLAIFDADKIEDKLVKIFGPKNNIEETIKRSIYFYLNKKHDVLCRSIDSTYNKYGMQYTKNALLYYMLTNDSRAFARAEEDEYGRENIESFINPPIIRLIVGLHFNDLDLLNQREDEIDQNHLNNLLNQMVEEFIIERHPVQSYFKMLKK